jgi:hypothetical protein
VIDERARVARAGAASLREVGGQAVLVAPLRLETIVLNDVGARVWRLAGRSLGEIVDRVAADTGEPRERVLADVRAFVAELAAEGLLEVR